MQCRVLTHTPRASSMVLSVSKIPFGTNSCSSYALCSPHNVQNLQFKDMSLLLANPIAFGGVIDALVAKYAKRDITAVVGIGSSSLLTFLSLCPPRRHAMSSRNHKDVMCAIGRYGVS